MSEAPRVVYRARDFATPEAELDALVAIYKFVLFDSQASKGGSHDLTNDPTEKHTTGSDTKGKTNADVHGN